MIAIAFLHGASYFEERARGRRSFFTLAAPGRSGQRPGRPATTMHPTAIRPTSPGGRRWAIGTCASASTIWNATGTWYASRRRSTRTWKWPRSIAASTRPAGRPCTSPGSRAAPSRWSATCSAPWSARASCSATRCTRCSHLVELKIDPAAFWKNPGATAMCRARCCTPLPQLRPPRPDPGPPDDDRRSCRS